MRQLSGQLSLIHAQLDFLHSSLVSQAGQKSCLSYTAAFKTERNETLIVIDSLQSIFHPKDLQRRSEKKLNHSAAHFFASSSIPYKGMLGLLIVPA